MAQRDIPETAAVLGRRHSREPVVLDDQQIEAAHAATGEGERYEDEHPQRGRLAEGWLFAAGLFIAAGALLVIGVHVVARNWQTISRWFA